MTSITPNRDAAEVALAETRARIAALPPPEDELTRLEREMSIALLEAVMRSVSDALDREVCWRDFRPVLCNQVANALVSVSATMASMGAGSKADIFRHLAALTFSLGAETIRLNDPDVRREVLVAAPRGGNA